MKKMFTFLSILVFSTIAVNAQIFWVENFESGVGSDYPVTSYIGPNGIWGLSVTGTEAANPNTWYVTCAEAGHTAGNCGSTCGSAGASGMGASLHVGTDPSVFGDLGATYFSGGACSGYYYYSYYYSSGWCVTTDRRAESPAINCTGKYGIKMKYYYIENGDGAIDDGSVWYYNGTTWSSLENPPKTTVCVSGQGRWAARTVTLPASANNNPNVKIGFRWVNNDDGIGTDPSFAIDSISLSTLAAPVASFTTSRDTACQDSCITFTNTTTGTVDSFRWAIVGTPYTLPSVSPLPVCFTSSVVPAGTYTVSLTAFNSSGSDTVTGIITIKPTPHPLITKAAHVLSVAGTYASFQWYNGATLIAGATNSSYTYTTPGAYSVTVDSGGCPGTATFSTVGVPMVNEVDNNYWVSEGNNTITLHAKQLLTENLTVVVTDQMGRQIATDTWARGKTNKEINGSMLAPGIYFIKLSNGNTSSVLKLMKE